HAFSQDMVLDVSAYNKDKLSDVSGRLLQLPDPTKVAGPGLYNTSDFRVLTTADFGNVRGIDVRLDRRFSNLFSGAISYTLQDAKNTGSDPFTFTRLLGVRSQVSPGRPARRHKQLSRPTTTGPTTSSVRLHSASPTTGRRGRRGARSCGTSARS